MLLAQLSLVSAGTLLVLTDLLLARRQGREQTFAFTVLVACSVASILCVVLLWVNHIRFPLHLDLMEGVVWQHFQRAATFQAIYPDPTPGYVPLAYNPLYYLVSVPLGWLLGVNLTTLRVVAILATFGCGLVVFQAVSAQTGSRRWGLVAAGLFATAYAAMDAYLDSAHSDSWMLFSALLGTAIVARNRSRSWNMLGILLLVASFWFKQHGALFSVGGVLYLTLREGLRKSLPYWLLATLLGPVAYVVVGPPVFGPAFHYFTWEVPRQWTDFTRWTILRPAIFAMRHYGLLALAAVGTGLWRLWRTRRVPDLWHWQLVFALLTALLGSLDPGSSDNVYIPMGAWFVVVGTMDVATLAGDLPRLGSRSLRDLALFASFALLLYNPSTFLASPEAGTAYQDLIGLLRGLGGPVYAPSIGQLSRDYTLSPAAHWVALEDMIRGPARDTRNHPTTFRLLAPAIQPEGKAFILANVPLDVYPWLAFLEQHYRLKVDLGDRFIGLRTLPKRWDHGWPRYLYEYVP